MNTSFDVLVIGGGINGLCAAYHLARMRAGRIALLERFTVGHDRGSSHGASRITRSSYHDPAYVELTAAAHGEEWPRLEADCGERLVLPVPGCFFGPSGGLVDRFLDAAERAGAALTVLDAAEGRRRYPQFRIEDDDRILDDASAGVLAAARTVRGLRRICETRGVAFHESTAVTGIRTAGAGLEVATDRGVFSAGHIVVTAGPWSARLVPALAPRLTVVRQVVGFYETDGPEEPGAFPVWAYLGRAMGDMSYGLPRFEAPGVKAARHRVSGDPDDPDGPDGAEEEREREALADLDSFVEHRITARTRRVATDRCLYTNTETEDVILDLHPELPGTAVGAGFSGHGFKFAPVTGRILAELAVHGDCALPAFRRYRDQFRIERA
jgi:sarcosine oxidase